MQAATAVKPLSLGRVLLCGAMIVTLSMGVRHGFGLWLQPITTERAWSRETFAFALAVQNLAWGLAGPIAGGIADRFGSFRVLVVGALLYAAGLVTMALAATGTAFTASAGLLVGIAQSGVTYAIVYGVIGRNVAPERRTWAMGVTAAAGSFGQFLMVPVESTLISSLGWQNALYILGLMVLIIVPLALGLREPERSGAGGHSQSIGAALREAFGYPSFRLLMAGYFVCGFQVVFIGVHMPSYLKDRGMDPQVATIALALIGQRWPKRYLLSAIYGLRSLAIVLFLLLPLTPMSVYVFCAVIGVLWLSTVPPTNAVVAQIFGVQYLSMLSGFVFLSHQIGSFMGVWLGGKLFDATGSYNLVWWIAVALGIFAAGVNLPVREMPIARAAPAAA
jgi:MFS family permease